MTGLWGVLVELGVALTGYALDRAKARARLEDERLRAAEELHRARVAAIRRGREREAEVYGASGEGGAP